MRARKVVTSCVIVQICKRESDHPAPPAPRIGFTVTKKMGNAVVRNRIKRRLRAAVSHCKETMQDGYDYILISRNKSLDCPFPDIVRDIKFAFSQIAAKK